MRKTWTLMLVGLGLCGLIVLAARMHAKMIRGKPQDFLKGEKVPGHSKSLEGRVAEENLADRNLTQAAPVKMNPYDVFSREAQSLKFPPGVDTVAYWGNGRFCIIGRQFFDQKKPVPDSCIFRDISAFRYENQTVYCRGDEGYLCVAVDTAQVRKAATIKEVQPPDKPFFHKLEKAAIRGNIHFDPQRGRFVRSSKN